MNHKLASLITSSMLLTALLTPLWTKPVQAAWNVESEFKLHLDSGLFDTLLKDFWQTLNGNQTIPFPDQHISTPVTVDIKGIKANVKFDFPTPQRLGTLREWELTSNNLAAVLTVDRVDANHIIERNIGGIIVRLRLTGECHNIRLELPAGQTHANASVRADLEDGRVKLLLSHFDADWRPDSWKIVSMECTGPNGFDKIVAEETLKALHSLHNFDQDLNKFLVDRLDQWSVQASQILLAGQEVPTNREDLKLFYEPKFAANTLAGGISLSGVLRFVFPLASKDKDVTHILSLKGDEQNLEAQPNSSLLMPFEAISALMMGSYMSGNFDFKMLSSDIPGFDKLMKSALIKFFVWPDLLHYKKDDVFVIKNSLAGPPALQNFSSNKAGVLSGQVFLPVAMHMYAPRDNKYVPYVEFRSQFAGDATIELMGDKAKVMMKSNDLKLKVAWNKSYVEKYKPSKRIGKSMIAKVANRALNHQGLELPLPSFAVGVNTQLIPTNWEMVGPNLRLQFAPKVAK